MPDWLGHYSIASHHIAQRIQEPSQIGGFHGIWMGGMGIDGIGTGVADWSQRLAVLPPGTPDLEDSPRSGSLSASFGSPSTGGWVCKAPVASTRATTEPLPPRRKVQQTGRVDARKKFVRAEPSQDVCGDSAP